MAFKKISKPSFFFYIFWERLVQIEFPIQSRLLLVKNIFSLEKKLSISVYYQQHGKKNKNKTMIKTIHTHLRYRK